MDKVTIIDTSVCTENIGDYIIMDAVNRELRNIFPNAMFFTSLTHDKVYRLSYRLNKISDYSFVGGTNLLSSNMNKYNQWKINLFDSIFLKDIILMGVGWWQYQNEPNAYTKYLLKSVLNKNILHSVRDSYAEKNLKNMGIENVINTGCMTMWNLTKEHCKTIPLEKSDDVVFTLTDYNRDLDKDGCLIDKLTKNYNRVWFWPQGSGDLEYFEKLKKNYVIEVLGGNIYSYDNLLNDRSISLDFVGTRLHAGIRALQRKRRAIILGIDNRAKEKSKDFNLKVFSRDDVSEIESILHSKFTTDININTNNINRWRNQFK